MEQFIEKLIGRLEEYKYSHLVEHDKERLEHCTENERAEHCEGIDCFWCVWDKSISIVNQLAEEHKGSWIPCSEKYPKDNQTVLTIDSEGNMEVLDYDTNWENSFCKYGGTVKVFNITAWQPLPEPYNTEGE